MKRFGLSLILVLALLLALCAGAAGEEATPVNTPEASVEEAQTIDEGFFLVDENDTLALYANEQTGGVLVQSKADGYIWRSNPAEPDGKAKGINQSILDSQLLVNYYNDRRSPASLASQPESVELGMMTMEREEKLVRFVYDFPKAQIIVAVEYSLGDGYLEVSVPVDRVKVYSPEDAMNTFTSVELLPAFGAADVTQKGYHVLPDGSGALMHYNNSKGGVGMTEYKGAVYGTDYTIGGITAKQSDLATKGSKNEQASLMPVFGTTDGSHGFFAIITENEGKGVIHAKPSGITNKNTVYSEFYVRSEGDVLMMKKEFEPTKAKIFEREETTTGSYRVRYYLLDESGNDYAYMASLYRQYLVAEKSLEKKVETGEYPLYLDLYGYVKKQSHVVGIPFWRTYPFTTISDIRTVVEAVDVPQTVVRYRHWVANSAYEYIPQNANIQRGLGTQTDMKAVADWLAENGGGLYPSVDLMNVYKAGNGFSVRRDAVLSPVNAPQAQYQTEYADASTNFNIKPWYLLSPMQYSKFYGRFVEKYSALNIPNLSFDGIGSMSTGDNRTDGQGRGYTSGTVDALLTEVRETVPSLMVEGGLVYAAVHADHILDTPGGSSQYVIMDEQIPFYQMVFHGYTSYSLGATNMTTDAQTSFLKCLEFGASPLFSLVARNKEELISSRLVWLYSPDYKDWLDTIQNQYAELNAVLGPLSGQPITGHRNIGKKAACTEYGTTAVYVNYSDQDLSVDGIVVPAKGYAVKEVLP